MWVSIGKAASHFGVCLNTLRNWDALKRIPVKRTFGNHRRFWIGALIEDKIDVVYCRVSSTKQKEDLLRQRNEMISMFPNSEVICDIGSSLNWNRKGLLNLMEYSRQGRLKSVTCSHRDRLSRFGFGLIQNLLKRDGVPVRILSEEDITPLEELTNDLMSLVGIFNARFQGLRAGTNRRRRMKQKTGFPKS